MAERKELGQLCTIWAPIVALRPLDGGEGI